MSSQVVCCQHVASFRPGTKYGHPLYLLETFVERDRLRGTVYRAANWVRVYENKNVRVVAVTHNN